MLSGIEIRAPAKINIGLKVLPKREDGFHNIESIFQTVALYDDLYVEQAQKNDYCTVSCEAFVLPADNTITAAYRAFCSLTGIHDGADIKLVKRIPAGGGLGGGSSDAASFIQAFARLENIELTDELADKTASLVGSDVFFFLHSAICSDSGGCAVVTGRGERVKPIIPRSDLHIVLVFPDVHSSTKKAYGLLDNAFEAGNSVTCPEREKLESVYNSSVRDWTFANSFTPVLVQQYPAIGKALADIRKSGALWSEMSGSGATVFGIYDSKESALHACSFLQRSWKRCVCV
jgi:4-diphosphocytidyl-2-C-methyl-D-erythritol kinase